MILKVIIASLSCKKYVIQRRLTKLLIPKKFHDFFDSWHRMDISIEWKGPIIVGPVKESFPIP